MSKEVKSVLRQSMTQVLKALDTEYIHQSSVSCLTQIDELHLLDECSSVSVYLAMPKEIQTYELIQYLFTQNKKIFIPKVFGSRPTDMVVSTELPVQFYT
jgi:5-formyltetrahydrofolate cyclo-ligase